MKRGVGRSRIAHAKIDDVGATGAGSGLQTVDLFEHIRRQPADAVSLPLRAPGTVEPDVWTGRLVCKKLKDNLETNFYHGLAAAPAPGVVPVVAGGWSHAARLRALSLGGLGLIAQLGAVVLQRARRLLDLVRAQRLIGPRRRLVEDPGIVRPGRAGRQQHTAMAAAVATPISTRAACSSTAVRILKSPAQHCNAPCSVAPNPADAWMTAMEAKHEKLNKSQNPLRHHPNHEFSSLICRNKDRRHRARGRRAAFKRAATDCP